MESTSKDIGKNIEKNIMEALDLDKQSNVSEH
jgi:hypothetical protein